MIAIRRTRMNRRIRRLIIANYTNTVTWPIRFAR